MLVAYIGNYKNYLSEYAMIAERFQQNVNSVWIACAVKRIGPKWYIQQCAIWILYHG